VDICKSTWDIFRNIQGIPAVCRRRAYLLTYLTLTYFFFFEVLEFELEPLADALPLEPCSQSLFALVIFK
jgi:hypothetical protein